MTERPNYIYQGGNVMMHSPLKLTNSEMYGFFVKGDLKKLQQSVDTTLNSVATGRMRFKVFSPFVMLTFTRVNHANSANPVDKAKGWGEETDIVTWIMVAQIERQNGTPAVKEIFAYPFHIWVNDCMALINGRELYGYPKYECQYSMPASGADPVKFTLVAKGFELFSPATQLAMHPLLEVTATDKSGAHRPLKSILNLLEEGFAILKSEPDLLDLDLTELPQFLKLLFKPQVQQIFLKQFPDSSGVKAVYQAIVAAPAQVDAIHSVQLLSYPYQCNLHKLDSFPLNQTPGLTLGAQAAILPFHVNFDFSVAQGEELVDNSQIELRKIAILGGGVSAMPMKNFPPATDYAFPAACAAQAKAGAVNQLKHQIYALWPNAATRNSFQWNWLVAPPERSGEQRFDSQFWRANIDPSERYVISVVGSSKYRLDTDGSGFKNLYLTGDWIKTGLNAGCVEAATMAGMQTSRAISGYPVVIKGESGF